MLLCTCFLLLKLFCLVILSIRATVPYGSDHLSDNIFVVILVHFSEMTNWHYQYYIVLCLGRHPCLLACTIPPGTWSYYLWTWILNFKCLWCLYYPPLYHKYFLLGFPVTVHSLHFDYSLSSFWQLLSQGNQKEGEKFQRILHSTNQDES